MQGRLGVGPSCAQQLVPLQHLCRSQAGHMVSCKVQTWEPLNCGRSMSRAAHDGWHVAFCIDVQPQTSGTRWVAASLGH